MAVTRIKNNQITDTTIIASAKVVGQSITGGLLADPFVYSGNLTVTGNLIVQGTTTTVDTTSTLINDPVIVLSRGETGTPTNDSGFIIERGTSDNAAFLWDETNDRFEVITTTDDGLAGGTVTAASYADLKIGNLISSGLTVSGLTNTRVTFAGTDGILTDNANLTFTGGDTLTLLGNANVTTVNASTVNANVFGSNGATTVTIANATATTIDIGGAATSINIGAATGTTIVKNSLDVDGNLNVDGSDITVSASTVNVANTNATTINFAGAATTLEIGAATGTTNINNSLDVDGNINLDGGNFTTTASTVNIANANTTTLNIGGASTSTLLGAVGGVVTLPGQLLGTGGVTKSSWGTTGIAYDRAGATFTDSSALEDDLFNNNMVWAIHTPTLDAANANVTYTTAATMYIQSAPVATANVNLTNAYALYVAGGDSRFVGNITATNFVGNVSTSDMTVTNITTPATNTNLTITPNGSGNVIISTATANRVFYSGPDKELLTSANFTFDGTDVVMTGDLGINGGDVTTTATTFNLVNTNATTVNFAGAATTLEIGAATGTTNVNNNLDVDGNVNVDGAGITTTAATVNIANANTTTINFAGAATTLEIGAATGTTNINNNLDVDGNVNVDGAELTTTAGTFAIANANTTTLNIGGAATTVEIGAATGTTIIGNDLQIDGNDIKSSTGNVAITLSDKDVTITGNLTIQGSTTNIGTTDLVVNDSLIHLHTDENLTPLLSDDGRDIGVIFHYYKSSDKTAGLVWANDSSALEYYVDASENVGNGTFTGTYGNIKAATFISNISTGTAPFVVNSTTQVANLNVAASGTAVTVTGAAQSNITSLGNLTIANIDNIQINDNTISSTDTNGNINLTPNGTGEVIASTLTVSDLTATRVVYAGASGALVDNANLTFTGSFLSLAGSANISVQANIANLSLSSNSLSSINTNGNILLDPNGTGIVIMHTDITRVGHPDTATDLTTNGAGTLTISTNNNVTSGNIVLTQGADANIAITPNGTGSVVIGNLAVKNNEIVSTVTDADIKLTPNGTGDILLGSDTVTVGDANTDAIVTTNGTGNLTLSTNGGTNSGIIELDAGTNANIIITPNGSGNVVIGNLAIANNNLISTVTNANINITPNGTGDVVLGADTVTVGDLNATANITTNGTGSLVLSTNDNTASGNITITQGANANITITANGTGEIVLNTAAVSDLTSTRITYAGANGTLIDNANLTFSGTLLTVTGSANISSQANIANININGNTVSSIDTNGNINIDANGTGYVIVNSSADSSDFIINGNTAVSSTYANLFYVKSSTGQIGVGTNSPATDVRLDLSTFTDSIMVPMGLTSERPTAAEGMIRYNTSTHLLEFYNGTQWTGTTGNFTTITAAAFAGDGSTVAFTLPQDSTSAGILVGINGVVQIPGEAYGTSGTTLTFTEAPQSGDAIDVRILTTTSTVTSISDLDTSFTLSDSAKLANVVIDGATIAQVGNTAVYPGSNGTIDLGKATTGRWKNVYATNTTIQNADLAEMYLGDTPIPPATVVSFGGDEEITITMDDMDTRVAGVISTNPAHVMNSMLEGEHVLPLALQGRVPCRVMGPVRKGDMMVSAGNGMARAEANPKYGSVIGKALEDTDKAEDIIEVVVGRL